MMATTVPMTRAPMAEKNVRTIVIRKAPRMSNCENRSAIGRLSVREDTRYAARPVSGRRTGERVGQEQGSGVGGLPSPGLKPAGPRLVSTAFCQEPSAIIFLSASVILVHR